MKRGLSTAATPARLGVIVRRIVASHPKVRIWLFRGPLGGGKTTAIRAVLRASGVKKRVVSPTYTLAQSYRLRRGRRALHIDAYRLRHRREWLALDLEGALAAPTTLVLVEWPERLRGFRWGPHGTIALTIVRRGRRVRWAVTA